MEKARQELCDLEQIYGLGHPGVLRQSMVLDELINRYNRSYYAHVNNYTYRSERGTKDEHKPGQAQLHSNTFAASFG
ncbi:hypothetical protein B9T62_35610 [Paenibacillus donghaensis]|uniref:Aspartyl-phosphate phosphatase Spo0E family protein n=2 Tax=Paenibacillus donghaensis TaxID=414771 RepID=A0A2Z2KTN1_9BACL|nr:hypothetical protein B9T62_35610 [Paenibacillus donghaensis]